MAYSYSVNEHNNTLTIYEDNRILCTIADADKAADIETLIDDIIAEMRG